MRVTYKSKADLYKLSKPHAFVPPTSLRKTEQYTVFVRMFDGWGGERPETVYANSIAVAIATADALCDDDEFITEVRLKGRTVWDCYSLASSV